MAFNSISSLQLTTINSITHPKVAQKIADNITVAIPFLHELNRIGNKEYESGGRDYWISVFKEMQTGTAYTGLTVFGADVEADPVTTALYQRKHITLPIVVSGTNLLKNSGSNDEAIISYLETLIETAQESMKDTLAGSSIGIMSSQGDSDLGITGLQKYLTTTTTTGTVGTLSRATYSFWREYNATMAAWSTGGLASMRTAMFTLTRGDEMPNLIITTRSGFTNFLRVLSGTISYNQPTGKTPAAGDYDFPDVSFHGAKIMFDAYCPDNKMYFLNNMGTNMLIQLRKLEFGKKLSVVFSNIVNFFRKTFTSTPLSARVKNVFLKLHSNLNLSFLDNGIGIYSFDKIVGFARS